MIPKKIHYCWFGGNPLPESVEKCIASWKKYCPDYEIIRWDESNYDVNQIDYMKEAYEAKKYAFVSDYARLDIVYKHGGIYLDTDVELIKNLDSLLHEKCFMGMELPGRVATGLGFGAEREAGFLEKHIRMYKDSSFLNEKGYNLSTCIDYTLKVLGEYTFLNEDTIQKFEDVTIYPTEYFCPLNMRSNKLVKTNNTYSIHWYDASWKSSNKFIRNLQKKLLPLKIIARTSVERYIGVGSYNKLKVLFKK